MLVAFGTEILLAQFFFAENLKYRKEGFLVEDL